MKIACSREPLAEACQAAAAALPARAVREVLSCFRLEADADRLTLTAFDLEVGLRLELRGVEVERAGKILLPAAPFAQLLRESRGERVEIDASRSDAPIAVRCGPARFTIPQRPVEEFPELPGADAAAGVTVEVPAGILRGLVRRTLFAADKRDASGRYALKGVYWEPSDQTLRLTASDGKRLATAEAAATVAAGEARLYALVPPRALQLLERVLHDDGELLRACLGANDVRLSGERAMIYTTLVQGQFPPYRDILARAEKSNKVHLSLPVEEFLAAVRQVRIMTDEESKRVNFTFRPGQAVLEAHGAATGSGQVELPLPEFAGPELRIAFDPDYLVEYLNLAKGEAENVSLDLSAADKPALFRCGEGWVYMVMPMVDS